MATAEYVQNGDYLDYTPGSAVSAGDVVVQGDLIGIAKGDIAADTLGALAVTGVFDVPKATGASTAITAAAISSGTSARSRVAATGNEIVTRDAPRPCQRA